MKKLLVLLEMLCAFGTARAAEPKDTLFFYNADTSSFNPVFLSLYSDGTFNFFQMPGGSCWAVFEGEGTWTKKGDLIELQFPPVMFTQNGDTVVYHKGLCRMRLHGQTLRVFEDDARIIAETLRTDENTVLFFGRMGREVTRK